MDKDVKKEIRCIIEDVFQDIKNGKLERGWEVYDAFVAGLRKLV